ncbi:MAG: potassium-transporting ATPase subunit KdpC [Betaproteobacteria bacterium]|nr:potassium-transporting ATPase subunit KdpC [Betaproteobacteria bacterium]
MGTLLRPALSLFVALTLLTGALYPVLVTVVARLAFPHESEGSLIRRDGRIVGSSLIGQNFTDPKYFWGRPSATGGMPYNASASSGSNQGPANPALTDAVKARIDALRAAAPEDRRPIPVDLVTASASGLDPEITIAGARYQVPRVAAARGLDAAAVTALVERVAVQRKFGFLGEPRVNVLQLNLLLDGRGS